MSEGNGAHLDPHETAEVTGITKIPLPTAMGVEQVPMSDGSYRVLLRVDTPDISGAFFVPAIVAIEIGKEMKRLGEACKAGLILPPKR